MKKMLYIITGLVVLIVLSGGIIVNQKQFGQLPKAERLERIKKSPNYSEGEFRNLSETSVMTSGKNSFLTMLDFAFSKKSADLSPKNPLPVKKTHIKILDRNIDVLVWFGHSSYYFQLQGKTFLVDPVFTNYASPFPFANKAFKGTNVYKSTDFPDIDYLIITHDHWDHLDYNTILELKPKIKHVICGLGVGQHFEYWGFDNSMITELDWYEGTGLNDGIHLTATPARHFSGRGLKRNKTLWVSFVLKTQGYNMYIGGDGGYDSFYAEVGEKFGPFDLAVLEQGQYSQNWNQIHLMPEMVYRTAEHLKASRILPVHHSKFALSNHAWYDPLKKITENSNHIPVLTPRIGEVVYLNNPAQSFDKWWIR